MNASLDNIKLQKLKMFLYFVLVFCTMPYGKCEEPHSCSQFYYVDKLLEKMIKMELKVEGMEKHIAKTNSDVLATLEELKREREEFNNDIAEGKKEMQDSIKKHETSNVVFKARSAQDKSLETGQTIIFTENMLNYGDWYDNTTGIFTAPVTGTYLFTFQLCVIGKQYMYYGLVYNNIVHTSGVYYEEHTVTCNTAEGMLSLNAGHKVWIKCLSGSSSSNVLYEQSTSTYNYWNTFSGMLIHT